MPDLDLREWTAYGNFVGVNAGDESESLFRVGDPDNAQAAAADHNALVAVVAFAEAVLAIRAFERLTACPNCARPSDAEEPSDVR